METWIPFLQTLVWPIFILIFLFWFRGWLGELLEVVKKRIETGSEMSVGPSGFSIGQAPKLEETSAGNGTPQNAIKEFSKEAPGQNKTALQLARFFHLAHSAEYDPEYSKRQGRPYFKIKVRLEADDQDLLNNVLKVVYHLHPTFPNPDREIDTLEDNFEMRIKAWGQFNLSAEVYFKDSEQPLTLFRYIDF